MAEISQKSFLKLDLGSDIFSVTVTLNMEE